MDQGRLGGGEARRSGAAVLLPGFTVEGRRVLAQQKSKTWEAFVEAVRRVTGGENMPDWAGTCPHASVDVASLT